jgi:hypothetical protein
MKRFSAAQLLVALLLGAVILAITLYRWIGMF